MLQWYVSTCSDGNNNVVKVAITLAWISLTKAETHGSSVDWGTSSAWTSSVSFAVSNCGNISLNVIAETVDDTNSIIVRSWRWVRVKTVTSRLVQDVHIFLSAQFKGQVFNSYLLVYFWASGADLQNCSSVSLEMTTRGRLVLAGRPIDRDALFILHVSWFLKGKVGKMWKGQSSQSFATEDWSRVSSFVFQQGTHHASCISAQQICKNMRDVLTFVMYCNCNWGFCRKSVII